MGLGYLLMSMGESFFSAAGLPRESVTAAEVQLAGEESATALDAAIWKPCWACSTSCGASTE